LFLKIFFQFIKIYGKGYKYKLFLLALFSLVMGLFEFFGLALIFPFIMLLTGDSSLSGFPFLNNFFEILNFSPEDGKLCAFVLCISIVGIYILKDICMILCVKYQNEVISDWQYDIYCQTLKDLIHSPYLKLSKLSFGDKNALLNNTLSASVWDFVYKVILLFSNGIISFCILAFLFYKFPLPAVVATVFLGGFVYLEQLFFKRRAKRYGAELLCASKKAGSIFEYTMKGIKEIKVSKNSERFVGNVLENFKDINHFKKLLASNGAYPTFVTEIGIISAFGLLAALIFFMQSFVQNPTAGLSGYMVSSLAVVAAVVLRLVSILNKVQSSMFLINQSRSSIVWFLKTASDVREWAREYSSDTENRPDIQFERSVRLVDAAFSYDIEGDINNKDGADGRFTLNNINLEIKKGQFVGIVGLSGTGKTTLMDLLTGLNLPSKGGFYCDDTLITKDNVRAWYRHVAVLPQEFFLLPLSVAENVAFGEDKKDIDMERVVLALKKAEIYNDIKDLNMTPELSHGQKHRLALARALYTEADVLFLDEATSSLDIETEDRVSKSIAKLKGEKTIIAIAHRLSTLKECDAIIYMKDGRILDEGSFKYLKDKYPDFENMLELSTFKID